MLLGIALLNLSVQVPLLMLTIINQQVISILTLAGSISYDKNLVIEDAFNQNMLGSFLLVRSFLDIFINDNKMEMFD